MVDAMIGTGVLPLTVNDFMDIFKKRKNGKNYEADVLVSQRGVEVIKQVTR